MVLDEDSEELVVIDYLTELMQRAEAQQVQQERIIKHQTFLKLPVMVNGDLALAKEEVCNMTLSFSYKAQHNMLG